MYVQESPKIEGIYDTPSPFLDQFDKYENSIYWDRYPYFLPPYINGGSQVWNTGYNNYFLFPSNSSGKWIFSKNYFYPI